MKRGLGLVSPSCQELSSPLVRLPHYPLKAGYLVGPCPPTPGLGETGCGKMSNLHPGEEGRGGREPGRQPCGGSAGQWPGGWSTCMVALGFGVSFLWFSRILKARIQVPVPLSLREVERKCLCGDQEPRVNSEKEIPPPSGFLDPRPAL